MFNHIVVGLAGFLSVASFAQANLSKPPNHPNLDYLNQGLLDNLHSPSYTVDQWGPGWIAADCASMTKNAGLNPVDVETFNVHYGDCSEAWVICRHVQSPSPLTNLIDRFGKLPVQTRQWVRHIIALPNPSGGWAYNWNGNIAMFNIIDNMAVFVHESGHSLDLLGAYTNGYISESFVGDPLSSNQNWIDNYNQDSAVADPYAQVNMVEDLAQTTVVASFNENVPGQFASVEPNWGNIFHQYATVITWARNAGANGISLLNPGGTCTKRLTNSAPIAQVSSKRRRSPMDATDMPDVSLSDMVDIIPPKEFHTGESCKLGFKKM